MKWKIYYSVVLFDKNSRESFINLLFAVLDIKISVLPTTPFLSRTIVTKYFYKGFKQ